MKTMEKSDSKRYYLHRRVKKLGFKINAKERTVFAPYGMSEFPKEIVLLHKAFNYGIQFEIV